MKNTNDSIIIQWIMLALIPLIICFFNFYTTSYHSIKTYQSCTSEKIYYLPSKIVGTCCVIAENYKNRPINNRDRLLIPYSDHIRIFWKNMHTISSILILLFLTPNLLYIFSFALKNHRETINKLAKNTLIFTYIFIVSSCTYIFKDS
ncbi:hypothetical protein EV682_101533 [Iodobacter fluviatilis]|uniref:Uncharacterized protein n=1 Tax=Iodobacter fluviatilis TaxID=537 RepID=A0A377Q3Y0_9NEIS|nr:hypothetical protein EV682_101533 [Iodobacter fluviatilis]STQ89527.1 Uncharacterised protein [Iodobacter fluviatilis]